MASGPEQGNYFALAERLRESAESDGGDVIVRTTRGSVDNLNQLIAANDDCSMNFALVQDGVPAPKGHGLQLVARLPKSESVFILGKNASTLRQFVDIRGHRVGIGPKGSGTDHLARRIFESKEFSPLALQMQNYELAEQVKLLQAGSLDLAIFVLDEDAQLMREAIRSGLQIASFEHLDTIARHFDFIDHGRIGAGQYDPIAVLPRQDHRVLRVDTLLLANDCASRTDTIAMLTLLQREFPGILQHNLSHAGRAFFASSSDAQSFLIAGGPEWADTHVPWLVDIMPLGNWFYVVMGISILFNLMTSIHKFRLWRIDVHRERAQLVFRELMGETIIPAEMAELLPKAMHLRPENVKKIDATLEDLDRLRNRCRSHESSAMVPMGQELVYRFQEEQIENILRAVRIFRARIDDARVAAGAETTHTMEVIAHETSEDPETET